MPRSLPWTLCLFALSAALPAAGDPPSGSGAAHEASLVVSGAITQREEIWDRRSNPLMGRPDVLKEIRLNIAPSTVHRGRLPAGTAQLSASIKGQKTLLSFRFLNKGMSGKFSLAGVAPPYELLGVESVVKPEGQPIAYAPPRPQASPPEKREFPENLGARELKASASLQKKAAQAIAKKYGMSGAKVVFLTSFSGPMPPDGGYLYWGVTGRVQGKWQVWQPGNQGRLRQGTKLTDPKRHQK